jgi:flagellar biosynthesis protein FlhA
MQKYQLPDGTIPVITLGMEVENLIREAVQRDRNQPLAAIEPRALKRFYEALMESIKKVSLLGYEPIILTSQAIRIYVKKLSEKVAPDLVVLSYNEILRETSIEAVDVLRMVEETGSPYNLGNIANMGNVGNIGMQDSVKQRKLVKSG